jgi:hypothetical protein
MPAGWQSEERCMEEVEERESLGNEQKTVSRFDS